MVAKKSEAVDMEARLRSRGYVPVKDVAALVDADITTVKRWISNREVEGELIKGRHYVLWRSVIFKLGVKQSVLMGLISDEQAKLIEEGR